MHTQSISLTLVRHPLADGHFIRKIIPIRTDRWQLAKLRWRATATDGREFGFELDSPLKQGDAVWENYDGTYVIDQETEDVLVVAIPELHEAAALAWAIGNLHQALQVNAKELITEDDSSVRHLLEQLGITFKPEQRVFQPLRSAHLAHHHDHP